MIRPQPTPMEFGKIFRGTSVTIPLMFRRTDETPFDLTDYTLHFTLKEGQWDFDYDDKRARIARELEVEYPETGQSLIHLTSKETWQPPGDYIFELTIEKDGAFAHLGMWTINIVGTPRNRLVNESAAPITQSDALWVTLPTGESIFEGAPIIVKAPLISNPPDDLVETIAAEPAYLLEELDDPDDPVRNIKIRSFAPKLSFAMAFSNDHSTVGRDYNFYEFAPPIPADCALLDGYIRVQGRRVSFHLPENGRMRVFDSYTQHSPLVTNDAHFYDINSDEPFWIGDNVTNGQLTIHIEYSNRHYVYITGNYIVSRNYQGGSHWVFRVDYFNWDSESNAPPV